MSGHKRLCGPDEDTNLQISRVSCAITYFPNFLSPVFSIARVKSERGAKMAQREFCSNGHGKRRRPLRANQHIDSNAVSRWYTNEWTHN